jgi:hypothetical protein
VNKAIANTGKNATDLSDEELISAIYAERGKKNASGGLEHFGRNSAAVQRGVANRFVEEQQQAQALLAQEKAKGGTILEQVQKQEGPIVTASNAAPGLSTVPVTPEQVQNQTPAVPAVSPYAEEIAKKEAEIKSHAGDGRSQDLGADFQRESDLEDLQWKQDQWKKAQSTQSAIPSTAPTMPTVTPVPATPAPVVASIPVAAPVEATKISMAQAQVPTVTESFSKKIAEPSPTTGVRDSDVKTSIEDYGIWAVHGMMMG